MRNIKNIIINLFAFFVCVPLMGAIIDIWIPGTKEVTLFLVKTVLQIFVQFELQDTVLNIVIYVVLAVILSSSGFYISAKTDNKMWKFAALIVSILGLLSGSLL